MKQEQKEKLYNDFPLLYKDKDLGPHESCMYWGIACGCGWYEILYELSEKLYPLIEKWREENPGNENHPRAAQVKEKFGTLRFYMTNATEEMYKLVAEAEDKSAKTCEACGAEGKRTHEGWVFTLCEPCEDLRESNREAFFEKLHG